MIWSAIVFLAAIAFARYVVPVPGPYKILAAANFALLTVFAMIFSISTGNAESGVDALKFYERGPVAWSVGFESIFQADLMYFLSGAIQSVFPISYQGFILIGALFMSYVGIAMIMRINPEPNNKAIIAWWVFTLLPGLHYWHATFSKEALQLLAIGCFFGFQFAPLRIGSLLVLLLVRPHIALFLAMAEVIAILFGRKKRSDILIVAIAGFIGISALTYLVERLGGSGFDIDVLTSLFFDYGENWRTSSLRLNDTSSLLAYPDYFLRPYPLEAQSFGQLLATLENIPMLMLIGAAFFVRPSRKVLLTPWLFLAFLFLVQPLINPNVGTSARKKQILPVVAIVLIGNAQRRRLYKTEQVDPVTTSARTA